MAVQRQKGVRHGFTGKTQVRRLGHLVPWSSHLRPGICRGPQEGDAPTLARPVPGPAFRRRRARNFYRAPPSSGEFPSVYFPFRHFRPLSVTFLLSAPPQKARKPLKYRENTEKDPKFFARCARQFLKHGKRPHICLSLRSPLPLPNFTLLY